MKGSTTKRKCDRIRYYENRAQQPLPVFIHRLVNFYFGKLCFHNGIVNLLRTYTYSHCAIMKLQRLVYAEKWRGKKQAANAFEVPIMQYQKGYVSTII